MEVEGFKRGMGLGLKLLLGIVLIFVIATTGINMYNQRLNYKSKYKSATKRARSIVKLVANIASKELASEIRSSNVLDNLLYNALKLDARDEDIAFILVDQVGKRVLSGVVNDKLITFKKGKTPTDIDALLNQLAQKGGKGIYNVKPVSLSMKFGTDTVKVLVGFSLARMKGEYQRELTRNTIMFAVAILILALYAYLALRRLVMQPLNTMVSGMLQVRSGDLNTKVTISSRDEIGLLANTFNYMVDGLREREQLQDAFNRYVSDKVYEQIQGGQLTLTGERRTISVLFSDIRSFTSISESLSPEEVVSMLNEYFTAMVDIVIKYDGYLNKFIGDAIMAVYNIPVEQNYHELRAVCTAYEMVESLAKLNKIREDRGQAAINIGIGINTGIAVAGNLGHEMRMEYTVIGDTVNLAQRIESQTKVAGTPLLISQATQAVVHDYFDVVALPPVKVKGKSEAVQLYAIRSFKSGMREKAQQVIFNKS